jgi:hypothetical protein
VTAILAKRVPSSVVSAITHTPPSGPNRLVTTPPMSLSSIATVAAVRAAAAAVCGAAFCWARAGTGRAAVSMTMASAVPA